MLWWTLAYVSIYLIFKLSARRRGCTISFDLQVPKIALTLFWRAFTKKVLPRQVKIKTLQQPA